MCLIDSSKVKKAEDFFIEHGNLSTLVGRLIPGIRQLISIPAGLAKMKLLPFTIFTLIGAAFWNIVLIVLGYLAHGQKDLIEKYNHEISLGLAVLGVLFIAYLISQAFKKKPENKETSEN
jgi:membrane protein DedA with SNARE-associated domain